MRVDHRRVDVAMDSQFLDDSNIGAAIEEVCGKRMAEGMARRSFRETGHRHGIPDGFLHQKCVEMMATLFLRLEIDPSAFLGKDPLPAQVLLPGASRHSTLPAP